MSPSPSPRHAESAGHGCSRVRPSCSAAAAERTQSQSRVRHRNTQPHRTTRSAGMRQRTWSAASCLSSSYLSAQKGLGSMPAPCMRYLQGILHTPHTTLRLCSGSQQHIHTHSHTLQHAVPDRGQVTDGIRAWCACDVPLEGFTGDDAPIPALCTPVTRANRLPSPGNSVLGSRMHAPDGQTPGRTRHRRRRRDTAWWTALGCRPYRWTASQRKQSPLL